MEGIPGNVGGGLRMNAGAMGVETFDQVVSVKFLDSKGGLHEKSAEELKAKYRNVAELKNNYAVSAVFKGDKGRLKDIEKLTQDSMVKRKASQPIAASAGCIFKNPDHISAGKLLEETGRKGCTAGAASAAEAPGNLIGTDGGATAEDVLSLIDQVKKNALEKCGVTLETEVQIIGEQQITY